MKTEHQVFTSGLVESETEPPMGDFLYYNRKYYSLSNQKIPYMRDKTTDDRFFILTLFGIAMELERENPQARNDIVKVNLPVGLPPAMTIYPEIKRHTKARIIDIGEFSVDYLELKNRAPNMDVCDSLENGVITLYNRIKSRVNSEFDFLLSEEEIDDINARGYAKLYHLSKAGR